MFFLYYLTSHLLFNVGLNSKTNKRETQVFPSNSKHIQQFLHWKDNSMFVVQHKRWRKSYWGFLTWQNHHKCFSYLYPLKKKERMKINKFRKIKYQNFSLQFTWTSLTALLSSSSFKIKIHGQIKGQHRIKLASEERA